MDFRDSPAEAAFREEVRAFIQKECPPELRLGTARGAMFGGGGFLPAGVRPEEYRELSRAWMKKLAARGWAAPHWPKEYGGAGFSVVEQFILKEEMALARVPSPGGGIGMGWAGPTIIVHGTEEQKKEHLPPIVSGERQWCQGFSEPGAGSDLASLQTRAVREGDDYVVNGTKIWTSGAQSAHWMILLARTDPDAPKHRGISYFLLDMKSPGISIQPLRNMAGDAGFNQVFFDNVRIPKRNLVGEENRGWYIGTTTLDFERSNIATGVGHNLAVADLLRWARDHKGAHFNRVDRPAMRLELADRAVEARVELMLCYTIISMQARNIIPNKESSIAKLFSSELDQRIAATQMKLLGPYGLLGRGSHLAVENGRIGTTYMYATASTVGGGTSEVQRNIIAQRGLGMPRD
ncbi:MAG TPA: acyl-CoA dehydrogenase family protein [Dehalococcoidia bacterium]|nr:acyl-CoA dehydrogenase family protein [Dehalococcoidia bacterium]